MLVRCFTRCFITFTILGLIACAPGSSSDKVNAAGFENCQIAFAQANICAQVIWEKRPTKADPEGTFVLEFHAPQDRSQFLDPNGTLEVSLGTADKSYSSPLTVQRLNEGQYRAANIQFPSPGNWVLTISLIEATQVVDQGSLDYGF